MNNINFTIKKKENRKYCLSKYFQKKSILHPGASAHTSRPLLRPCILFHTVLYRNTLREGFKPQTDCKHLFQ